MQELRSWAVFSATRVLVILETWVDRWLWPQNLPLQSKNTKLTVEKGDDATIMTKIQFYLFLSRSPIFQITTLGLWYLPAFHYTRHLAKLKRRVLIGVLHCIDSSETHAVTCKIVKLIPLHSSSGMKIIFDWINASMRLKVATPEGLIPSYFDCQQDIFNSLITFFPGHDSNAVKLLSVCNEGGEIGLGRWIRILP